MSSAIELGLVLHMVQIFAHSKLNWNHTTVLTEVLYAEHNITDSFVDL